MTIRRRLKPWREEVSVKTLKDGSTRIRYGVPIRKRINARIINSYRDLLNVLTTNLPRFMGLVAVLAILLMVKESSFPLASGLSNTFIAPLFLKSVGYSEITMSIATGLFAGYFVWLFDSYLPGYLASKKSEAIALTLIRPLYLHLERLYHELGLFNGEGSPLEFHSDELYIDELHPIFSTSHLKLDENILVSAKRLELLVGELRLIDNYWDFDTSIFIAKLHNSIRDTIVVMESGGLNTRRSRRGVISVFNGLCVLLVEDRLHLSVEPFYHRHGFEGVSEFSQYLSKVRSKSRSYA
ncbi:hypothetical protein G5G45_004209 [Vibrio vulnificus]|nr:hypothetical protein [Vibrio vulnificus]